MGIELERSAQGNVSVLAVSGGDIKKAAPDAICTNTGYGGATSHPLTEDMAGVSLASIAAHFGGLVNTGSGRHIDAALVKGMSSVEFSEMLETTGRRIVSKVFERDDTLNRIARPLPQANMTGQYVSQVQMAGALEETVQAGERRLLVSKASDVRTGPMTSWGAAILIRRRDIVNNDQLMIANLFSEAARLAQRHEIKTAIDFIDSNPTLPELDSRGGADRAWFTAGDGNLVTGASAGLDGLDAANQAIRAQESPDGEKENIAPRFILCPSGLEYRLRQAVRDADAPLEVIATPHIDASRYYLMADPARQPALGIQFIGRPTDRQIKTWVLSAIGKMPQQYDGVGHTLDVDMKPEAMSRKGIVRVELT